MTQKHTPDPCPFCRCPTEVEIESDDAGYEQGGSWISITLSGEHAKACPFRQTSENGVVYDGMDFTPEEAIAAWGTRSQPAKAEVVEKEMWRHLQNFLNGKSVAAITASVTRKCYAESARELSVAGIVRLCVEEIFWRSERAALAKSTPPSKPGVGE